MSDPRADTIREALVPSANGYPGSQMARDALAALDALTADLADARQQRDEARLERDYARQDRDYFGAKWDDEHDAEEKLAAAEARLATATTTLRAIRDELLAECERRATIGGISTAFVRRVLKEAEA